MIAWLFVAALLVGAYLCGSVPFGWLIGRLRGFDIREHGSRNIGATNCGRVCGWPWGILAFVLDVVKGFVPVCAAVTLLPGLLRDEAARLVWLAVVVVAVGPILGHTFPAWLRLKGGKAVATSLGVLLALPPLWWIALAALGVWIVVTAATAYVSVGSTVAALAFGGIYGACYGAEAMGEYLPVTVFVAGIVVLVIVRHTSNYVRLAKGTENRVWGKKRGGGDA
ncbi:MAG: glycerol-3-phosphate 1-O-acyltransferase PlsY [Planctomycetota bacterium]|nr:glycerol-3-phosphate 1-O-acyltransferase PlsY [Planctomycetota bacterium]